MGPCTPTSLSVSGPGTGFLFKPLEFLVCVSMQGSSIGKEAMMGTFVLRPENLGS